MKITKQNIALWLLGASALCINIVFCFLLPDTVKTQIIIASGPANTMNKYIYFAAITFLIEVTAVMGIYLQQKQIKYIVLCALIYVSNAAVIVVNMI
ncbi:MAG: hypothetical protein RR246_00115 [Clostridia bacterium]